MLPEEAEKEIEKLKLKIKNLKRKSALTNDFNKKEKVEEEIRSIESQVEILEKLKKKP